MLDLNIAKEFFDIIYTRYNTKEYIKTDPIRFVYDLEGNKEFIAFTSSLFAYGNVPAINKFLLHYFKSVGTDPIQLDTFENKDLYYRFQRSEDIAKYSYAINKIYDKFGSIKKIFAKYLGEKEFIDTLRLGVIDIRSTFKEMTDGVNFLLPVPGKSASKRLVMFSRWMIRKDAIDLGLWSKEFDKRKLYMPIDTHIMRMGVSLGVVNENTAPKVALTAMTDYFKRISPDDPAKYDFSLSRLGIANGCQYERSAVCENCKEDKICIFIDKGLKI